MSLLRIDLAMAAHDDLGGPLVLEDEISEDETPAGIQRLPTGRLFVSGEGVLAEAEIVALHDFLTAWLAAREVEAKPRRLEAKVDSLLRFATRCEQRALDETLAELRDQARIRGYRIAADLKDGTRRWLTGLCWLDPDRRNSEVIERRATASMRADVLRAAVASATSPSVLADVVRVRLVTLRRPVRRA